jgi:hypothetical protein
MHYFTSPACYDPAVGFAPKGYGAVIDWGYTTAPGFGVDLCLQAMLVNALASCVEIATAAGDASGASRYASLLKSHTALVRKLIGLTAGPSGDGEGVASGRGTSNGRYSDGESDESDESEDTWQVRHNSSETPHTDE